jgi:hypothetical protein
MPIAHDTTGLALKNSSAILLARVVGDDGEPIAAAEIDAVKYSITQLDDDDPDVETPVAGHTDQTLAVGDVLFESLQIGGLWDVDSAGYNFRHAIDVGSAQAFAQAGVFYRVRYDLTVSGGQAIVLRFKLKVI